MQAIFGLLGLVEELVRHPGLLELLDQLLTRQLQELLQVAALRRLDHISCFVIISIANLSLLEQLQKRLPDRPVTRQIGCTAAEIFNQGLDGSSFFSI